MVSELTKFTLDGTELEITDSTARTTANTAVNNAKEAQKTANSALSTANTADTNATDALSKAGTNETNITKINSVKVVKTAKYDNTTKTLAITTGTIG